LQLGCKRASDKKSPLHFHYEKNGVKYLQSPRSPLFSIGNQYDWPSQLHYLAAFFAKK